MFTEHPRVPVCTGRVVKAVCLEPSDLLTLTLALGELGQFALSEEEHLLLYDAQFGAARCLGMFESRLIAARRFVSRVDRANPFVQLKQCQ